MRDPARRHFILASTSVSFVQLVIDFAMAIPSERRWKARRTVLKQEYSLAHLTVLGCTPPEMTYIAARAGYDYVSIRPISMGLPGEPNYALPDNPQMLKQTKTALASTGVRVHDIELARVYEGVHPSKYLPAMEVAAELGAKAILSSIWGGERAFYIEKFAEICDLAKPFGLTVDLEYVPIAVVRNLAQALDVLRTVNRTNAGLMIDVHHFHRARDNPADLDALPREWFHFAHLCDANVEIPTRRAEMIRIMRDARLYVGEGGIDVAGILAHIPHCVYSIEVPNRERHEQLGYAEHAKRCLETLKAYLIKHARHFETHGGSASNRAATGIERADEVIEYAPNLLHCICPLLAHRVILWQRSNSVAFGAKRTLSYAHIYRYRS